MTAGVICADVYTERGQKDGGTRTLSSPGIFTEPWQQQQQQQNQKARNGVNSLVSMFQKKIPMRGMRKFVRVILIKM